MEKIEIVLETSDNFAKFVLRVNKLLAEGWKMRGKLRIVPGNSAIYTKLIQVLIKEDHPSSHPESWMNEKCANCGASYGIHCADGDLCPEGGKEALPFEKQSWGTTTFKPPHQ